MKNLNQTQETNLQAPSEAMILPDLNMSVYNELHDQTQSEVNVLAMINEQFKQIFEMNKRRSFLLKEVSGYLVK
ncbi:hypothetical protein CIK05_05355 [Bdellovibrio sp. qaytius]|nr:hypothetical protein CIK05_05355 [Bdellovibrio sp. qaytius]